jgi:hypothetical protein
LKPKAARAVIRRDQDFKFRGNKGKNRQKPIKMGIFRGKPQESCGNQGFCLDFACPKEAL